MTELLFFAGYVLIFQYSFINKYMAIFACAITIIIASLIEANLYYVLGMIFILGAVRITKTSVNDEY